MDGVLAPKEEMKKNLQVRVELADAIDVRDVQQKNTMCNRYDWQPISMISDINLGV